VTEFHFATGKRFYQAECKVCYRLRAKENMRRLTGYYDRHPDEKPGQEPQPKFRDFFPEDPEIVAVRKRHKQELEFINNYHTRVAEGFVYVVTNPAWPGWVKIGCAIDPGDRTNGYQTGSPFRDYELQGYSYSPVRRKSEAAVHRALAKHRHGGEWFFCPVQEALDLVKKFCLEHSTHGRNSQ
jgi:hypothetical protein